MFSYCTPSSGAKYIYRADGMRSQKIEGLTLSWIPPDSHEEEDSESSGYYDAIWATNKPTTRYYYDGQMCAEEDYTNSPTYTVTRYGIGARGVDYIAKTASSTTIACPLYDAHGNMIATVNTSGTLADGRYYDAWGSVIGSGSATGDPKGRYCASIGHVQDDESGLIYMRARYYEPGTGRFVSEDSSRDGWNAYAYAGNCPSARSDPSGKASVLDSSPLQVANALWWISAINGAVQLYSSIRALSEFVSAYQTAADSLDLENAWGKFMKSFNKGIWSFDASGSAGLLAAITRTANSIVSGWGTNSSIGGVFQTLTTGFFLGAQFAILGLGYQLRLHWYVADIGNE